MKIKKIISIIGLICLLAIPVFLSVESLKSLKDLWIAAYYIGFSLLIVSVIINANEKNEEKHRQTPITIVTLLLAAWCWLFIPLCFYFESLKAIENLGILPALIGIIVARVGIFIDSITRKRLTQ